MVYILIDSMLKVKKYCIYILFVESPMYLFLLLNEIGYWRSVDLIFNDRNSWLLDLRQGCTVIGGKHCTRGNIQKRSWILCRYLTCSKTSKRMSKNEKGKYHYFYTHWHNLYLINDILFIISFLMQVIYSIMDKMAMHLKSKSLIKQRNITHDSQYHSPPKTNTTQLKIDR